MFCPQVPISWRLAWCSVWELVLSQLLRGSQCGWFPAVAYLSVLLCRGPIEGEASQT